MWELLVVWLVGSVVCGALSNKMPRLAFILWIAITVICWTAILWLGLTAVYG